MPLDFLGSVYFDGTKVPYWEQIKQVTPFVASAILLKLYTNGSSNTWERKLHGKVYIMTGGTSGIGSALAKELASKGAQLVLLSSQIGEHADNSAKVWMTDYVNDLREVTGNELIYSEYCDLSSLHSIRKFATKWLDNSPARRLDGVICLANESIPMGKLRTNSIDGVERQMAINYLGHYHLLTLLEPALRAQPADRDVRVLISSCLSQNMGDVELNDLLWEDRTYPSNQPWKVYGTSKLLLNMFAKEFQRRVQNVPRPDKQPCPIRVNIVNPGVVRSPGMRRFLSMGSIFGLVIYLLLYPVFWLLMKSCQQGMQSYLFAINNPNIMNIRGGNYIKECTIIENETRRELNDEALQKKIYNLTSEQIVKLEKASAIERNRGRKVNKKSRLDDLDVKGEGGATSSVPSNNDKTGLFTSAFTESKQGDPGLYPDMNKIDPGSIDEAREARLRHLDEKYMKSREVRSRAAKD